MKFKEREWNDKQLKCKWMITACNKRWKKQQKQMRKRTKKKYHGSNPSSTEQKSQYILDSFEFLNDVIFLCLFKGIWLLIIFLDIDNFTNLRTLFVFSFFLSIYLMKAKAMIIIMIIMIIIIGSKNGPFHMYFHCDFWGVYTRLYTFT